MASTREVAHRAGVSIGTVSRALNNKPGVSAPVRERILAIAQQLNYSPPRRVSHHVVRVTHLGLLVRPRLPDLSANPFYSDVYHGIEQACRELDITLTFGSLETTNGRLAARPSVLADERVRGLILTGAMPPSLLESVISPRELPAVLVDNWFPGCPWDAVMIDNWAGATLAVEYALSLGHRNIAYMDGPDHPSLIERRLAYCTAMRERGLEPCLFSARDLETADGVDGIPSLLQAFPNSTAVLFANDSIAVGAMVKLRELGYRIPEDISVVGFDDIAVTQLVSPALTTVHVDRVALGRTAVELLLSRISNPTRPPVRSILGVYLVTRASVCPPAAARRPVATKTAVRPAKVQRLTSGGELP